MAVRPPALPKNERRLLPANCMRFQGLRPFFFSAACAPGVDTAFTGLASIGETGWLDSLELIGDCNFSSFMNSSSGPHAFMNAELARVHHAG
jgi:hypothetical protein